MQSTLRIANLALLILFPLAWFAPLMRAGLLPLFGLSEISVISGLQSLWGSDVFLALIVTAFALFAPYLKTISLALLHFNLASPKLMPALSWLSKLAMADIFLIALYVVRPLYTSDAADDLTRGALRGPCSPRTTHTDEILQPL